MTQNDRSYRASCSFRQDRRRRLAGRRGRGKVVGFGWVLLGHSDASAARVAAGQCGGTVGRSRDGDRVGVRAVGRRLMVLLYNGRGRMGCCGRSSRTASDENRRSPTLPLGCYIRPSQTMATARPRLVPREPTDHANSSDDRLFEPLRLDVSLQFEQTETILAPNRLSHRKHPRF